MPQPCTGEKRTKAQAADGDNISSIGFVSPQPIRMRTELPPWVSISGTLMADQKADQLRESCVAGFNKNDEVHNYQDKRITNLEKMMYNWVKHIEGVDMQGFNNDHHLNEIEENLVTAYDKILTVESQHVQDKQLADKDTQLDKQLAQQKEEISRLEQQLSRSHEMSLAAVKSSGGGCLVS